MENFYGIFKNFWAKNIPEGATCWPQANRAWPTPGHALMACGAPAGLPTPLFSYMVCFTLEKIISNLLGWNATVSKRKPRQRPFCTPAVRFCRGNSSLGGGDRSHRHHQRFLRRGRTSIHQHIHQHHLISKPSSSLVFNLYLKTSDWYLWVTSSVYYIL